MELFDERPPPLMEELVTGGRGGAAGGGAALAGGSTSGPGTYQRPPGPGRRAVRDSRPARCQPRSTVGPGLGAELAGVQVDVDHLEEPRRSSSRSRPGRASWSQEPAARRRRRRGRVAVQRGDRRWDRWAWWRQRCQRWAPSSPAVTPGWVSEGFGHGLSGSPGVERAQRPQESIGHAGVVAGLASVAAGLLQVFIGDALVMMAVFPTQVLEGTAYSVGHWAVRRRFYPTATRAEGGRVAEVVHEVGRRRAHRALWSTVAGRAGLRWR